MEIRSLRSILAVVSGVAISVLTLTGCSGPAPNGQTPQPQPPPPASTTAEPPAQPPDSQDSQPPVVPDKTERTEAIQTEPDSQTQKEPEETPSQAPKYVTVLERIRNSEPYTVTGVIASPSKLVLETSNVSRLRIERRQLTMARGRRIVLRIDGRGIEWTSKTPSVELVRGRDGVWSPVEPLAPKKP